MCRHYKIARAGQTRVLLSLISGFVLFIPTMGAHDVALATVSDLSHLTVNW
jgi:hypothetical protein